jgi:hypothetical protein
MSEDAKRDFIKANTKFRDGDSITDAELALLLKVYSQTVMYIELFGPEYRLFINDARANLYRLEGYHRSRKEKR